MSSHETTSGRKLSKKARQIFRREHEAEVKLAAQKVGRLIGNAIGHVEMDDGILYRNQKIA